MSVKKRVPVGALVRISWIDADQSAGWSHDSEEDKTWVMCTFGLYRKRDRHFVYYGDTMIPGETPKEGNTWGGKSRIPTKTVVAIDVLDPSPEFGKYI